MSEPTPDCEATPVQCESIIRTQRRTIQAWQLVVAALGAAILLDAAKKKR